MDQESSHTRWGTPSFLSEVNFTRTQKSLRNYQLTSPEMKKKSSGFISLLVLSIFTSLVLGIYINRSSVYQYYYSPTPTIINVTETPLLSKNVTTLPAPEKTSTLVASPVSGADLFASWSLSEEEEIPLNTWNFMKDLVSSSDSLPNSADALREASAAWNNLMASVEEKRLQSNGNSPRGEKHMQCPHYLSRMSDLNFDDTGFKLRIPCGLIQGSSITFIGIPTEGSFRVDLIGETFEGEELPPIVVHYEVRLHGDKLTEDPVIVQNAWTKTHDWGKEERCPGDDNQETTINVDELERCNEMVGKGINRTQKLNGNSKKYFPFKQNDLFAATLRVNYEGIQLTVDGKHITSFAFRGSLEPWLVSEVRISGDVGLMSVIASGLPTSEDLEHIIDLESLKAVPTNDTQQLNLLIGVISTANNFESRMAVRRSWMQYPQVRSGEIAVRFFVGLHKNQMVNEELWREAIIYQDIQLLPFVEYYSLLTLKTLAICIYGTEVVSSNYIMKTDDDSFVRVDEILDSLTKTNITHGGLFYGHMNFNSLPSRDPNSKWYLSHEEWPHYSFPVWANGPGYAVSSDIAKTISKGYKNGSLEMIKLEDVSMGIWIEDMKMKGKEVRYVNEDKIGGCGFGFVVAHYQNPRELLCLWQKVKEEKRLECCESK